MTPDASTSIALALINNLPMIITAVAALIAAVMAITNKATTAATKRGVDRISDAVAVVAIKADTAAVHAETAAVKADELHATSKTIADNTNGRLSDMSKEISRLMTTNEGLQATINTLTVILANAVRPLPTMDGR